MNELFLHETIVQLSRETYTDRPGEELTQAPFTQPVQGGNFVPLFHFGIKGRNMERSCHSAFKLAAEKATESNRHRDICGSVLG